MATAKIRGVGEVVTWKNQTGSAVSLGDVVGLGVVKGVVVDCGHGATGPNTSIANLSSGEVAVSGKIRVPKLSTDTCVEGDRLYWDAGNTRATVTKSTHAHLGVAASIGTNGGTYVDVLLNKIADFGEGDQTLADGKDIALGTTTGSKIGTAVGQKLGFWAATPVVQPAAAAQGAVTATAALTATAIAAADATDGTGADGTTPSGAQYATCKTLANELKVDYTALLADVTALAAKIDANVTLLNAMRTALVNTGIMKGAA